MLVFGKAGEPADKIPDQVNPGIVYFRADFTFHFAEGGRVGDALFVDDLGANYEVDAFMFHYGAYYLKRGFLSVKRAVYQDKGFADFRVCMDAGYWLGGGEADFRQRVLCKVFVMDFLEEFGD